MGLDVYAYRIVRRATLIEEQDEAEYIHATDFPERLGSVKEGYYFVEPLEHPELSMTYSGYTQGYRGPLSQLSRPLPWGPFWAQVYFTDCDGWLGPEVCKELAEAYAKHRERAVLFSSVLEERFPGHREWWLRVYDKFAAIFRAAANDPAGVVRFG